MSDITPGVTNNVPIGTDVFGDTLNPTTIVNYVLLVRTSVPAVIGINASGGPGVNGQPPGPGVIGQAGAGGDADGVRGNGSGSFSGVAGFADSGATANSGIGVFGKAGGPQKPLPGQPPQAGGPGVRGFGGSNEFGNDANGVEGFASGSFSGVA